MRWWLLWFLVRVEEGPWEKFEENKKSVKSNFRDSLLSSLLVILEQKIHFWPFLGKKMSFLVQKCTFLTKITKSEESRLSLKFDFTYFLFSSHFSQGPPSTHTRNHIVPISETDVQFLFFNFFAFFLFFYCPLMVLGHSKWVYKTQEKVLWESTLGAPNIPYVQC